MRAKTLLSIFLFLFVCGGLHSQTAPKREFRGAWIQAVNGQFQGMPADKMQQTLTHQLDVLRQAGINAIIFQIRPEADALYAYKYEPWSRFLTGVQGKAPVPAWDPLQFMIEECHKRNMELHAWINPYRAKTKGTTTLAGNHPAKLYPDRFLEYDGQLYFDPGLPENRAYICTVVKDIVERYDVDGLHIDDYFYPYPVPNKDIRDDVSFAQYGTGYANRADWRRNNVNLLIRDLHHTIRETKPWVKFGISPFGIYRNQKSDPDGSRTNGLQNYDDLYADILLWVNNGWVDYTIPQVYWEIGHPAADYQELVGWWARHADNRPLFIGLDKLSKSHAHAEDEKPTRRRIGLRSPRLRYWAGGIAAGLALCLVLAKLLPGDTAESYVIINGKRYTDPALVQVKAREALDNVSYTDEELQNLLFPLKP